MQHNIEAVLNVMKYIYDNIMYAELNTKSDYCMCCDYDGEIKIEENEEGKLIWKCPNCGNTDQSQMSVTRRTCGQNIVHVKQSKLRGTPQSLNNQAYVGIYMWQVVTDLVW